MSGLFSAKLQKLNIKSYRDIKRLTTDYIDQFDVMFNPESYSLNYDVAYSTESAIGKPGAQPRFNHNNIPELNLKLVVDGTGVSNPTGLFAAADVSNLIGGESDVYERVQRFFDLAYEMKGTIHQSYFLVLSWGKLSFPCRLKSLRVHYSLFTRSGAPLRAELDTTFVKDVPVQEEAKKTGLESPDLTHVRVVKANDQLPMLCEEIYGSPHYYVAVAKANNLRHFRDLVPGQEIFFPPLEV